MSNIILCDRKKRGGLREIKRPPSPGQQKSGCLDLILQLLPPSSASLSDFRPSAPLPGGVSFFCGGGSEEAGWGPGGHCLHGPHMSLIPPLPMSSS